MRNLFKTSLAASAVMGFALAAGSASAQDYFQEDTSSLTNALVGSGACAVYGDFVSCASGFLNVMDDYTDDGVLNDSNTDFYIHAPQGELDNNYLVIGSGGSINNDEYETGGVDSVDDAYKFASSGNVDYWSTQYITQNNGSVAFGDIEGPDEFGADYYATWDIEMNTLVSYAGQQIFFIYDMNQTGNNIIDQSEDVYAIVSITDDATGAVVAMFELFDDGETGDPLAYTPGSWDGAAPTLTFATYAEYLNMVNEYYVYLQDPGSYAGPYNFEDLDANNIPDIIENTEADLFPDRDGSDSFFLANANNPEVWVEDLLNDDGWVETIAGFCIDPTDPIDGTFYSNAAKECSDDQVFVSNNLGSNTAEFINFIPELNLWIAQNCEVGDSGAVDCGAYTMHVDFRYTGNTNGFEDLFILAGGGNPPEFVPEPATLTLFGAGLLGLGYAARRRRKAA
ncbi:MAG: PEP-CTERM sorting domain-containing protein [Magnetospiraceae bacterium]